VILGLGEQSIAGLLGITKQHVSVLLEEDGVVDSCIADTKRSLHHNHLQCTDTNNRRNGYHSDSPVLASQV